MSTSTVIPATLEHVAQMTGRLREADEKECQAFSGKTADEGLRDSFAASDKVWAFVKDGRAECMFGRCRPSWMSFWGVPWLLATTEVERLGKTPWRISRRYVREMMRGVDLLQNYVDSRNTLSMRWLVWCGFEIEKETVPVGPENAPFHRFELRRNSHV